jgi:hypothetical protein
LVCPRTSRGSAASAFIAALIQCAPNAFDVRKFVRLELPDSIRRSDEKNKFCGGCFVQHRANLRAGCRADDHFARAGGHCESSDAA